MNARIRQRLLGLATGAAMAAAAAIALVPAAASAAPTTVTANANLRATPGGAIIDTVSAGETVNVQQCQGSWCYITRPGPDGWMSAQYLAGVNTGSGLQFGFSIGPGGQPNVSIGVGSPPEVDDEADLGDEGEVCFFDRSRYRGDSFCMGAGEASSNLRGWADRISSFDNPDGLDVTVCSRTSYRGVCRTYTSSARTLGALDNDISSVEIE